MKIKEGQEITVNIPFTYTIGEVGYYSGKVLETIEDCKAEVLAEVESSVLNTNEIFLSVEQNK